MLPFFGQERVSVDANGRVKLCPRFVDDFKNSGGGDIVLLCLPEGGLAVYPEEFFLRMRRAETVEADRSASNLLLRRRLRFTGAMTFSDTISNQGRITIPHFMREECLLRPGEEAVAVGVEVGIEIWSAKRWLEELEKLKKHSNEKGEREMASDLLK